MRTYQDFDAWLIERAKALPTPRGDRAAQQAAADQTARANQVQQQAQGVSQGLMGNAQGIFGPLTNFGEGMMTAPPGYGAALPLMEGQAAQVGAETRAGLENEAQLNANRTRNSATLADQQDAIAEATARGTGANIQDILAQNEQLKNQQMMEGSDLLKGIYGENLSGGLNALGEETGAVNAGTNAIDARVNAGKSGWLQNATGILGTLGGMAGGAGSIMRGIK